MACWCGGTLSKALPPHYAHPPTCLLATSHTSHTVTHFPPLSHTLPAVHCVHAGKSVLQQTLRCPSNRICSVCHRTKLETSSAINSPSPSPPQPPHTAVTRGGGTAPQFLVCSIHLQSHIQVDSAPALSQKKKRGKCVAMVSTVSRYQLIKP